MPGIRELADSLCNALAAFEPGRYSGADCARLAEVLVRTAKTCETAGVRAAARAAKCGADRTAGDASAVEWLARVSGSSTGQARAALETVKAVDACPATKHALLAGGVSLAQAGEITSLPGHESELLGIACASGLGPVKDAARKRRLAGIDPEELSATQQRAREVVYHKDELSMICVRMSLPPNVGVSFVNRLDSETDRERRAAKREGRFESRAAHAADAFMRMVGGTARGKGRSRAADLVVVQDLRAYRRGHAHPGEVSHIIGGGPIPVRVARALAQDAFLKVVLHDGVQIHTVAHLGRCRPAELETALQLGAPPDFDGVTCAELGCDRTYGLQWDHKDPVANRGPTSAANLQPLCFVHHTEKTERDRKAGLLTGKRSGRGPP